MGVKFNVLDQVLDTLREGLLHRVHHLSERIAEGDFAIQNVPVESLTNLLAEANGVCHVVIAVLQSDSAIEISEEDELGVLERPLERLEIVGLRHLLQIYLFAEVFGGYGVNALVF